MAKDQIFEDDIQELRAAPSPDVILPLSPASAGPEKEEASPQRKTVEAWATAKGLLPQVFNPPAARLPGVPPGMVTSVPVNMAGLTGPRSNPEYWRFAAARAAGGWPEGKEMTEEEFDAAIKAAGEHVGR